MAILPIYEVPHPILKEVARPVAVVDDRVRRLLDDLAETMYAAPGIGLAAPQVGVLERILVTAIPVRRGLSQEEDGDDEAGSRAYLTELINPEIIEKDGEVRFDEGCLSVPELTIPVDRYQRVVIRALDRQGEPFQFEAHDFYAVVFQHEMDHLDGKTLVDRLSKLKRAIYLKKLKKKRRDDLESSDDAAPPPD
jgi:peptide deformylase